MRKLITGDQEIKLISGNRIYPADLPDDIQNIKLTGNEHVDLDCLNLNIVKYEIYDHKILIHIASCNINKLVLNGNRWLVITNSTINNIYIQSEVMKLEFMNTNIPNLHGRVDLINKIEIEQ